jgi:hypothetical protein
MTRQPQSCPICGRLLTKPLLRQFHITAEMDGIVQDVHALGAYMCEDQGHIFFIRATDLEGTDSFRATA